MAQRALPSQEVLRQLLDYDPETGALTWRKRGIESFDGKRQTTILKTWNSRFSGKNAFSTDHGNGYSCGLIKKQRIYAHRVAWKWFYGDDPDNIDHINGDRKDNRIENIRSVSKTENARNSARPKSNTSGYVGVSFRKADKLWEAYIGHAPRTRLGRFSTIEAAARARHDAEVQMGYHANHGR